MTSKQSDFLTFLEYFINDFMPVIAGFSKNTIKSYKYSFQLFFKYMALNNDMTPDQISFKCITPQIMLGFMRWLKSERKCSSSTLQQRLAAFLTFSAYAQNRNFDAACSFRNSVLSIPRRKAKNNHRAIFTVQEIDILLKLPDDTTSTGYRDMVMLSFMYSTGTRAQEVCDVKVDNFIFGTDSTIVIIHGKGNKTRRVPISRQCSDLVMKYMKSRKIYDKPEEYLFKSRLGKKMTIASVEWTYNKYVEKAKALYPTMFCEESYTPHSMRHSTASHMLDAGVPLTVIKNFLGHSSLQTTQIYAEISANKANQYLKAWNEKWFTSLPAPSENSDCKENYPVFLKV